MLSKEALKICQDFIIEYHNTDLLRSYNIEPRNRLLFVGPPGNGKTTLAEAIAEALVVPLFVVRYENIIDKYLGETAFRLRKIFDYVSTRRCVLFFDEFETLGKERGDIHEIGEIKRIVSALLLQIDKTPSNVVVIGATNHEKLLDYAVWHHFQIHINLLMPTQQQLKELFKKYINRTNFQLNYPILALAKKLVGISFAEAEEFIKSIFRQYILNLPKANVKDIVSQNLKFLTNKLREEIENNAD